MFTGLVWQVGRFRGLRPSMGGWVLDVEASFPADDPLALGESVAVQGVCLTVTAIRADGFSADVLDETLRKTTFRAMPTGARVNLERALKASDRFGGHVVQGHVDALAEVVSLAPAGRDRCLRLACDAAAAAAIVYKGSVALDGVSLTISAVPAEGLFEVHVIPTTWAETSLSDRRVGDALHLETDVLGRYAAAFAARADGGVNEDLLRRAGFDA